MNQPDPRQAFDGILVALDASPHSLAALQAAAELAALFQVELRGIFVEDINLLHVCGLPFSQEVGSFSANVRRLDSHLIERQFRTLAAEIKKRMEEIAGQAQVRWSFEVTRGGVSSQILAASERASMVSLGRAGRSTGRQLGSTARSIVLGAARPLLVLDRTARLSSPLAVVYTGSPSSAAALRLALQLGQLRQEGISVLILADADQGGQLGEEVAELAAGQQSGASVTRVADERALLAEVRAHRLGTLIAPASHAHLLVEAGGSAILMP